MQHSRRVARGAFTLVELVVVIAIIGVLIGLLLPAVQQVRAAAARAKCGNNMHQIGVALTLYHDSQQAYPAGMRYQNGRDPYLMMSWHTQLLPYLDQEPLWARTQAAYR